MAAYKKLVFVALLLALVIGSSETMLANGVSLCHMDKEGLTACKPSVSGQYPAAPSAACCSAISHADMQCLCLFKNSNLLNLYGINTKLALELPAKCNLAHPPC